ncbi:MAG: alpha glucosidase [Alphaproteobacteria bacterium]|nr:alpha glucosidase [Alphaproteobacteria bacterium]
MQEAFRRKPALVDLATGPEHSTAWWRGAVIYQIYPRSFYDSNGDGIGDLPGILAKLDYVASLGVDAIWLSPFFTSPMKDFGYDVADYRGVDPVFGTLADFDRLVRRAHELGIKVLIDQVWGHSSDRHPWFLESRMGKASEKADWYVWADAKPDGTPPNNWLSVFGGAAWSWEPRRRQYFLHHFLASQPQLNLRNPAVLNALLDAGFFWLDRGVDGFRFDAVDFLMHDAQLRDNPPALRGAAEVPARPFGFQHHLHDMLDPEIGKVIRHIRAMTDAYPGTASLAEVSSQDGAFARIAEYTQGDDRLHMAYTLRLLRDELSPAALRGALRQIAGSGERGWLCWSFSNHDATRVVSRAKQVDADGKRGLARMLLAILTTLRGSACLYQGEELGLPEAELDLEDLRDPFGIAFYPEFRGRDGSRTPMPWNASEPHAGFTTAGAPWLPVPRAHCDFAVSAQDADLVSPLSTLRRLLRWRKSQPALLHGDLVPLDLDEPLFGFERRFEDEQILVACNFSCVPAHLPIGSQSGWRPLSGHGFASELLSESAILPAYGVFFAKRGGA